MDGKIHIPGISLEETYWDRNIPNTTLSPRASGDSVEAVNLVEQSIAAIDYYVETTGSDVTGDGSIGNPFATAEKAYDELPLLIKHECNIYVGAGTYYGQNQFREKMFGVGGSVTVFGDTTVDVAEFTLTSGSALNANGYSEWTLAAAGWGVNAYAGKWIRVINSLSPLQPISQKYFYIISNTADTLISTNNAAFTPGANTKIEIVTLDTTFSGASAGSPTNATKNPIIIDDVTTAVQSHFKGLYYQKPFTIEGFIIKNPVNAASEIYRSAVQYSGCEIDVDSGASINFGISVNNGSVLDVAGIAMSGKNFSGFINRTDSELNISGFYGDFTGYTGTTIPVFNLTGAKVSVFSYYLFGDAVEPINNCFNNAGVGCSMSIARGRVDYATQVIWTQTSGYTVTTYSNGLYGANNTTLYRSDTNGFNIVNGQSNITATQLYRFEDESQMAKGDSGGYTSLDDPAKSQTVTASSTLLTRKQLWVDAAAPTTMTSTPTLAAGLYDGQRVVVEGTSDTNTVTLQDNSVIASTLVFVDPANKVLGERDRITFVWNDTDQLWYEEKTVKDFVDFNTAYEPTHQEGRVHWNDDDKTLEAGMAGGNVNLQIGQELLLRAKAIGSDIDNGDLVYISGGSGSQAEVTLAKADAAATATGTIALATEDVSQNQFGYFTTIGLVRELDTSAYSAGDELYLSSSVAGGFTGTKPVNPNYCIEIGQVVRVHATEGVIFARINNQTVEAGNVKRTYTVPTTQTVVTGTLSSGTVSDVQAWQDGNEVHISEVTGSPGFDVQYTFPNVTSIAEIMVGFYYVGSSSHDCQVQIYDDANTTWKELLSQSGAGLSHNLRYVAFPDTDNMADYINGSDEVKVRFYHPTNGNASHDLYIDYMAVIH